MASLIIQVGPQEFMEMRRFRTDTYRKDGDIKRDPGILVERAKYENREHIKIDG